MNELFLGFLPQSLPLSCLTMAPRLDTLEMHNNRKPLSEMNMNNYNAGDAEVFKIPTSPQRNKLLSPLNKLKATEVNTNDVQKINQENKRMLQALKEQLHGVLKSKPAQKMASSAGIKFLQSIIDIRLYILLIPIFIFFRSTKTLSNIPESHRHEFSYFISFKTNFFKN